MLKQQLNFKLSQKLSPQQIQLMKLIQLPTQAFEQRISQELRKIRHLREEKKIQMNLMMTLATKNLITIQLKGTK